MKKEKVAAQRILDPDHRESIERPRRTKGGAGKKVGA